MSNDTRRRCAAMLVAGLVVGGFVGLLLSQSTIDAVATDRQDNFAMATGPMDFDLEALFFLDFLTGNLKAAVLSTSSGKFTSLYETNVMNDLRVDPTKNPKYLLVTGLANLRRAGGQIQPGNSVVYVADVTSGRVAAYAIPWSPQQATAGAPFRGQLLLLDVLQFRTAAVRD